MLLERRKVLSGRLVFIEAAEPFEPAFVKLGGAEGAAAFAAFRSGYFERLRRRINSQPADKPLDVFLAETLASYKNPAEDHLSDYPALFEQIWGALEAKVRQVSCQDCLKYCGAAHGKVCDNSRARYNHELVAQSGLCIKSLREIYEVASTVARLLYANCCPQFTVNFPPEHFSTVDYKDPAQLHDLPVRFFVRGETQFVGRGTRSQVELGLASEYFDYQTYTATPYVLFHECIAHAFYSVLPTPENRQKVEEQDMFYEGWMDYAAFKVAESVLSGGRRWRNLGPVPDTPANQQAIARVEAYVSSLRARVANPKDFVDAATAFHQARFRNPAAHLTDEDKLAGRRTTDRTLRAQLLQVGVTAADKFRNFLDVQFPEVDPLRLFLRISFELNMLTEFDYDRRLDFVYLTYDLPAEGERKEPQHDELYNIVHTYLKDADILNLMECCYTVKEHWTKK
jgi:hypothetical protein